MSGKCFEDVKTVVMHRAQQLFSSTATYGDMVDTLGYDSAQIVLNVGICKGVTTLTASVYENHTWSGDTGIIAVTGADFTAVTSQATAQQKIQVGAIETKNYKRYLSLKLTRGDAVSGESTPTLGVSAVCILSKGDTRPTGITPTFNI